MRGHPNTRREIIPQLGAIAKKVDLHWFSADLSGLEGVYGVRSSEMCSGADSLKVLKINFFKKWYIGKSGIGGRC